MAANFAHGLTVVVLATSLFGVSMANKDWNKDWSFGFNYTDWWSRFGRHPPNKPPPSKTINVGGSENWHYGFNYSDWSIKNHPFYLNDTLVFKYDPPSNNTIFPHSVYVFPNYWSFLNCELKSARRVANTTEGGGDGFQFVIKKWQPYYFACGERNGIHCRDGQMKFAVMPMLRPYWPWP